MDNDYSIQLLEKKLQSVPEDVQIALVSPKNSQTLERIADNFGLTNSQSEELFNETAYVMLGLTNPVNFTSNLAGRLPGIPKEKLRQITGSINEEIFKPIKDSLAKIHNISSEDKVEHVPIAPKSELPAETIWESVAGAYKEKARKLVAEHAIKDLQEEKMKALERLTELNKKMHETNMSQNMATLEAFRAEALAIQNKISEIDTELRGLRREITAGMQEPPRPSSEQANPGASSVTPIPQKETTPIPLSYSKIKIQKVDDPKLEIEAPHPFLQENLKQEKPREEGKEPEGAKQAEPLLVRHRVEPPPNLPT